MRKVRPLNNTEKYGCPHRPIDIWTGVKDQAAYTALKGDLITVEMETEQHERSSVRYN